MLQMFSAGKKNEEGSGRHGAAPAANVPGSRVVDILAEGVEGSWTPATHLKIMKVSTVCIVGNALVLLFVVACMGPCHSGGSELMRETTVVRDRVPTAVRGVLPPP